MWGGREALVGYSLKAAMEIIQLTSRCQRFPGCPHLRPIGWTVIPNEVHSLLHTVQNLIMDNHWRIRPECPVDAFGKENIGGLDSIETFKTRYSSVRHFPQI